MFVRPDRRVDRRALLTGLLGACAWLGCAPSEPARAPSPPLPPLKIKPVSSLATAAGLSWIVLAKPKVLFDNPGLHPGLARLFPEQGRAVLDRVTAIRLDRIQDAAVVSYASSTLFLIDGGVDAFEAERRYHDRLMSEVIRKSYRPDATWVKGADAGGNMRSLAALAPGTVAIESGGSLHAKVALLYGIGRLQRAPRALSLPDVALLAGKFGDAPLRGFAPGPFEGEWKRGLRGLLAACSAAGVAMRPAPDGSIDVSIRFVGAWEQDAPRAAEHVAARWQELASSTIGRVTGLATPVRGPTLLVQSEMVGIDVTIDGAQLLDGLHDLVAADVRDILAPP